MRLVLVILVSFMSFALYADSNWMFNPGNPASPVSPMNPINQQNSPDCREYLPALGLERGDRIIVNWNAFSSEGLSGRYYNVRLLACGADDCETVSSTSSVDTGDGATAMDIDSLSMRARTVGCHRKKYGDELSYRVVLTENFWGGRWDEPAGSIEFSISDLKVNRSFPLTIGLNSELSAYISRE